MLCGINFLIGGLSFLIEHNLWQASLRAATDMVISLGLGSLILLMAGKIARILQTLIALLGISAILNILSLPMLFFLLQTSSNIGMVGILLYSVFIWDILIMGHIFRQALSAGFTSGLLVSMSYVFIAMMIFYLLFPVK